MTSLRLPPVRRRARGRPLASTRRWCLEPPHGLCPPGSGPSGSPLRLDLARVGDRARPLDLPRRPQAREQERVQRLPHPGSLPLIQTAVAGRARAEAELERQVAPGHPRVQHEQDPLQRLPIGESLATRIAKAPLPRGQKRLDELPQLVGNDPRRGSHRHPSQLDDECRRPSSSGSGSLHFDSTS